jgi:hypothetical protein
LELHGSVYVEILEMKYCFEYYLELRLELRVLMNAVKLDLMTL